MREKDKNVNGHKCIIFTSERQLRKDVYKV